MSIWSDIWSNVKLWSDFSTANIPGIAQDLPQTPEGQAAIGGAGFWGALIGFLDALTDITTWRSLAWILLGAVLLISGIVLWLRDAGVIPQAVPVPVPV